MAHDLAHAIIAKAVDSCECKLLNIEVRLCQDTYDAEEPINPEKTYTYFRKVPFQVDPFIGSFKFALTMQKALVHEGFVFLDLEECLRMLMYQYILHAAYLQDITTYDVIVMDVYDGERKLAFCFHVSLSEIPISELDSITAEVIEKIMEPLLIIHSGWQKQNERLTAKIPEKI